MVMMSARALMWLVCGMGCEMREDVIAIAEAMNGISYDNLRNGRALENIAREAQKRGCIIIYGISDDIVRVAGAIDEEIDAWDGTVFHVADGKLVPVQTDGCEDCELYKRAIANAVEVKALWEHQGYRWYVEAPSNAASEPFIVYRDGETFCRGIVMGV